MTALGESGPARAGGESTRGRAEGVRGRAGGGDIKTRDANITRIGCSLFNKIHHLSNCHIEQYLCGYQDCNILLCTVKYREYFPTFFQNISCLNIGTLFLQIVAIDPLL